MVLYLCVAGLLAAEAAPADQGKTEPPGVPLSAVLTSKEASYTLDLGGKTADEARQQIEAGNYPLTPSVDLNLELRNTGDKDLLIRMGGTTTVVELDLKGPDVINVTFKGRATNHLAIAPKTIRLAPGKSQSVAITRLSSGFKEGRGAYWLAPGKYTLTARYKTTVSPAPEKAVAADEGFGEATIISAPLVVTVEGK